MLTFKLAFSNLRVHRIRLALTVSAIALSVSLVVAVTSGYASSYASGKQVLNQFLGSTDVQITRKGDSHGGIPQSLLAGMLADPEVESAHGRLELDGTLMNSAGGLVSARVQIIGVQRPVDKNVEMLPMERGKWFDRSDTADAVVDQVTLERLGAKVGGTFVLPSVDRRLTLRIVGVVHKPGILAALMPSVYVPLNTIQDFMLPDDPRRLSRIMVNLKVGVNHAAFVTRWRDRLDQTDPNIAIRPTSDNRASLDRNFESMRALSYLGSTVSVMAATFIIFSALSMGVAEQQRTLAMLRAIGAFRTQLGKLVVFEGILLAMLGVFAGIPLGVLWINLLAWRFPTLLSAGAVVSLDGLAFAAGGALVTALAASLLPALSAMRASPLDAMTPLAQPTRTRGILIAAVAGILLMGIDPLLLFGPFPRSLQFYGHFMIGLPAVMLGFFLIAPVLVRILEFTAGPILAAMLGLRFTLLRQQLSGGVWRAAGTCAALMVGLAILIVSQIQGTSAIQGWKIPTHFPDIFIFSAFGLSPADQQRLAEAPGIRPGQLMPIAMASPEFGSNPFAVAGAALLPESTLFLGVEPEKAFKMMELDFLDGNAVDAERLLKQGRHIVVTQEFRKIKGLGVGDTLALKTNKGLIDFTIAGVVWATGIDIITATQDLGQLSDQRTAATVFGSLDDARELFGVERIGLFAANLELGLDKAQLMNHLKGTLGSWGLQAGDVRQLKHMIQQMLSRLLALMSTVAYAALAVASLGVTNTIMASIRSRRWHFGILRSIGITRSQLLRMVLAEAVMLGILGVVLGLAAGFELAFDARKAWGIFFGYDPEMVIPWTTVIIGVSVVMLISILASLWPAIHVARSEPLTLLQAGRSSV